MGKMSEDNRRPGLSRRGLLGIGGVALGTAGILAVMDTAAQQQRGLQSTAGREASDPVPTNQVLDVQNPDSSLPLSTDAGAVQTFKYPFSFAHKRVHSGGWSREVTARELTVS